MRRILTLVALVLWLPSPGWSQNAPDRCGDLTATQDRIDRLGRYFTDDQYAWWRQAVNVQQLGLSEVKAAVTSRQVCGKVARAVESELKKAPDWREIQTNGYRYRIFQFGPYYVALVILRAPPGTEESGWARLMVFRADTIAFLGESLV